MSAADPTRTERHLAADRAAADDAQVATRDEVLRAAVKHMLTMVEGRVWRLNNYATDTEVRCSSPVGPDEPCGECIPCWTYHVEKAAASLRAALSATDSGSADL